MKLRFENKVVLITGGNSGIGLATAKAFAAEGARVIVTGRNPETLQQAEREIGHAAVAIKMDVASLNDLDALYARIKKDYGFLDVVFVNAGVPASISIEKFTEETFDEVINVNLKGAFFTAQKAVPLMTRGGSIIFNASMLASLGRPGSSVYSATKAGVRSMARSFSCEFLKRGIRANSVSPGPIKTPIWNRSTLSSDKIEKAQAALSEEVPMKRLGESEDIAGAVLFLASEESAFIAGTEIAVDGGITQL